MKKRILALLLAWMLLLSGCASMTSRDYLSIQPHKDPLAADEDAAVPKAGNYQELTAIIYAMVKAGEERGVIHLSNYQAERGDVENDLAAACAEVAQQDPLGAYAVDFIKHDQTYIVSYYEAGIQIAYRRTPEQVKNIVTVTGSSAVRAELQEALSNFETEKVLRISYFTEDAEAIRRLVRQAYYSAPQFALGMPGAEVAIYPAEGQEYTGTQRIVEILLTYPEDQETMKAQALALAQRAEELGAETLGLGREARARSIYDILRREAAYTAGRKETPARRDTAYAALVEGAADSEGLALAFQLLCQQEGLESYVVSGGVEGTSHFWNIVETGDGEYRHVDASLEEGFALSDADLAELGYVWDKGAYRACGAQPPEPDQEALTPDAQPDAGPLGDPAENAENNA